MAGDGTLDRKEIRNNVATLIAPGFVTYIDPYRVFRHRNWRS